MSHRNLVETSLLWQKRNTGNMKNLSILSWAIEIQESRKKIVFNFKLGHWMGGSKREFEVRWTGGVHAVSRSRIADSINTCMQSVLSCWRMGALCSYRTDGEACSGSWRRNKFFGFRYLALSFVLGSVWFGLLKFTVRHIEYLNIYIKY